MRVKTYLDEINEDVILGNSYDLAKLIDKLRREYGYYNVGVEFNEGICGFDLYVMKKESALEKKARLIEGFADILDEFDVDVVEDVIDDLKVSLGL